MGGTALADAPKVAVDIAPVHSLVAQVMQGIGVPKLIVQPGASPHEYSLRPSEASALQEADLVFWIGEDLAPWMEDAVETLATDATVTTLLETDDTLLLDVREGALFEAHDHGAAHDDHDDHDDHHGAEHTDDKDHGHDAHAHEDHDEDKHSDHEEHEHDDHADHDNHDGHAHGAHDPHAWLSPRNASAWLNVIAAQLSAADPDNAGTYFANASAARADIEALAADVGAMLDPVRGGSFIVFHDAYQYFEKDFDFPAAGAISLGDASDPSPARIAEIQGLIRAEGIDCVLAEPQFNLGIVTAILDGTEAKTGVIDPLGASLDPGAPLYPKLIRNMAQTLAECL
ncbi:zinc transporter [Roseobacter cerasinus]|uniref:High-affinity zinc uptake system protein ZnuA n=2 Tax=Roseobacter cerasinus TaxID=2602289 RepID=A0A640VWY1_9RHOB|nr:zinc transporter [Roseobacter cerasinus]